MTQRVSEMLCYPCQQYHGNYVIFNKMETTDPSILTHFGMLLNVSVKCFMTMEMSSNFKFKDLFSEVVHFNGFWSI